MMFPKALPVYEAAQLRKLMRGRTVTLTVHMANDCLDARLTQPSALEVLRDAIHAKNDLSYYAETSGFEDGAELDERRVPMVAHLYGECDVRLTTF